METASELGRPAVEPLSRLLLKKFGKQIRNDRVKQMIGHMTRQVMESEGFSLHTQNLNVRTGGLFSKASRYLPPDADSIWDDEAKKAIKKALKTAKWNLSNRKVTVVIYEGGMEQEIECGSLEELRNVLYRAGVDQFNAFVPHDGSDSAFEFDESMVDEILDEKCSRNLKSF
jgi:hypothetical protein